MNRLSWYLFVFLCLVIGLYPYSYLVVDMSDGLLITKSPELIKDVIWSAAFYTHIFLGGASLLLGWSQFNTRFRTRHVGWHRTIGKLYLICVTFSGLAALYLAPFATGGTVPALGFASLGALWLFTSAKAYSAVRNGQITKHQNWMIRSYALCFAAVMLRLWLPFMMGVGMEYIEAYRIVGWLCWVPNILVAEWMIRRRRRVEATLR